MSEQRASDADRERTVDALRRAAGEGRLTVEELDERLERAYGPATVGELEGLTADVVEAGGLAPQPGRLPVRPGGDDGTTRLISVFGGADRTGHWRVGRSCRVVNVFGGADLDLNDAELAAEVVEMRIISVFGGSTVHVPEGLNVEVSELAVLGGNGIALGPSRPDPGGPVLRLRLISVLGGTDVKRGRRRSLSQRLAERRARHRHLGH